MQIEQRKLTLIALPSSRCVAPLLPILLPFLFDPFGSPPSTVWRASILLRAERHAENVAAMHQAVVLQARLLLFLKSESVRPLVVEQRRAQTRLQIRLSQSLLPITNLALILTPSQSFYYSRRRLSRVEFSFTESGTAKPATSLAKDAVRRGPRIYGVTRKDSRLCMRCRQSNYYYRCKCLDEKKDPAYNPLSKGLYRLFTNQQNLMATLLF